MAEVEELTQGELCETVIEATTQQAALTLASSAVGFDLYFAKPLDLEELLNGLAELFARPPGASKEGRG